MLSVLENVFNFLFEFYLVPKFRDVFMLLGASF
jgi:hypothetical protein